MENARSLLWSSRLKLITAVESWKSEDKSQLGHIFQNTRPVFFKMVKVIKTGKVWESVIVKEESKGTWLLNIGVVLNEIPQTEKVHEVKTKEIWIEHEL